MFSFSLLNYFLFFFDQQLIITTCFFFFLFFILLSDKGQIGSSLADSSSDSISKLSKSLALRETLLTDLSLFLDKSISHTKRLSFSYHSSSHDLLFSFQFLIKKLSTNFTLSQIKAFQDVLIFRTQLLSSEVKNYFTHQLFSHSSFRLSSSKKFSVRS